jgi:hypothetical protein
MNFITNVVGSILLILVSGATVFIILTMATDITTDVCSFHNGEMICNVTN